MKKPADTAHQAASRLQARNQELGVLLVTARQQQGRTIAECAALIATSRRRYAAMERGTAPIHAAELECLLEYLEIDPHNVWHALTPFVGRRVVITSQPGEAVHIVFQPTEVEQV